MREEVTMGVAYVSQQRTHCTSLAGEEREDMGTQPYYTTSSPENLPSFTALWYLKLEVMLVQKF